MAGYGSPSPPDRGAHAGRRVARPNPATGSQSIWSPEQAQAVRQAMSIRGPSTPTATVQPGGEWPKKRADVVARIQKTRSTPAFRWGQSKTAQRMRGNG